jgi:chemotaxis family two-component system response regulator Rcp1
MNTQGPALDWPSVNESWIGIMGGSGSNPIRDEDRPSASHSPLDEQTGRRRQILIVEDNPADVFLIRAAIKASNIQADIQVVKDGEQAIRFFDEADQNDAALCPALIVLDINLPRKSGGEVLHHIRKSRRCGAALVLAVSTSASTSDREFMMRQGANGYFRKPSEYSDFMKLGDLIQALLSS